MEQPLATIRIELGISARQIISQFQTNNQQLEEVVTKGIERALEEILQDENFENLVCETVKDEIWKTVREAATDWTVRTRVRESLNEVVEKKVIEYAEKFAEALTKNIKA